MLELEGKQQYHLQVEEIILLLLNCDIKKNIINKVLKTCNPLNNNDWCARPGRDNDTLEVCKYIEKKKNSARNWMDKYFVKDLVNIILNYYM